MTLKSRAIKSVVGFGSIGTFRYVVSFGAQIAFARLLSPEAFGIVALGAALMTLIGLVGRWGIAEAVMQDVDQDNVFSTIFWLRLGYAVGIVAIVLLASPFVAIYYDTIIVETLIIFAVSKGVVATVNPLQGVMTRDFQLTYLALSQFVSLVVSVAIGMWMIVYGGFDVWGLIAFYALQDVLNAVFVAILSPQYPKIAFDMDAARWFAGFARRMWLSKTTGAAENQFDDYLVGTLGGTVVLGVYNIAWKLTNAYTTIFQTAVTQGILPTFSRLKDDPERSKSGMEFVLRVQCYVVVPVYLFVAVTATDLVVLMFGGDWIEAGPVLSVLAFAGILYPLVNTVRQYYYSIGQTRIITAVNVVILLSMGALIPPSLHVFGGVGVALSMIAVEIISLLLFYRALRRDLHVSLAATFYPSLVAGVATLIAGGGLVYFEVRETLIGEIGSVYGQLAWIATAGVVVAGLFYLVLFLTVRPRLREDVGVIRRALGLV